MKIAEDPDGYYPVRGAQRRYPLSTYIKKKLRGKISGFLCDELHEYNNASGQGDAMAELYGVSKLFVGMTATLINGYSSGIFHLLYRIVPGLMLKDDKRYRKPGDFDAEYGVVENTYEIEDAEYNSNRRANKRKTKSRLLPGVSPLVFSRFLLEYAAFLSLTDMNKDLPSYEEIPIALEMPENVRKAYEKAENILQKILRSGTGIAQKILSAYLNLLTVYPDQPYDQPEIVHPIDAEHPSLAVGTADVRVLGLTAVIQPHENTAVMLVLVEQLFMYEGGNNLAVNVALTHKVSIHTSHGSIWLRQSEGLRSLLCRLCLLIRFVIFPAQQKQNRLLIREAVIALDEADGVAADARGVIKPFVAPHGDAGIIGRTELPAGAHRSLALGAQQRHEVRVLRTCFFLRREIDKLAHDVSFQIVVLSVDNMCFITYDEVQIRMWQVYRLCSGGTQSDPHQWLCKKDDENPAVRDRTCQAVSRRL